MKTIHKYQITRIKNCTTSLAMPSGAEILSAHLLNGAIFVWALVDPEAPALQRNFEVIATGEIVGDEPRVFIGTVFSNDGAYVMHVFERTRTLSLT